MTACVIILWIAVSIPTAKGFVSGSLFQAPCLVKLPELLQAGEKEKMKEPEMGGGGGQVGVRSIAVSENGNEGSGNTKNTRWRHK